MQQCLVDAFQMRQPVWNGNHPNDQLISAYIATKTKNLTQILPNFFLAGREIFQGYFGENCETFVDDFDGDCWIITQHREGNHFTSPKILQVQRRSEVCATKFSYHIFKLPARLTEDIFARASKCAFKNKSFPEKKNFKT